MSTSYAIVGLGHRAHMFLHDAEILPQGCERDLGPGRPRRHTAQDFCGACHFRDYSGSSHCAEVTLGLLPLTPGDADARLSSPTR